MPVLVSDLLFFGLVQQVSGFFRVVIGQLTMLCLCYDPLGLVLVASCPATGVNKKKQFHPRSQFSPRPHTNETPQNVCSHGAVMASSHTTPNKRFPSSTLVGARGLLPSRRITREETSSERNALSSQIIANPVPPAGIQLHSKREP